MRGTSYSLPHSKPCDLSGDAAALEVYYDWVDRTPNALAGQHPIRRWEYAMALYAIDDWRGKAAQAQGVQSGDFLPPITLCDVGGGGSHFWEVLARLTPTPVTVIDTTAVPTIESGQGVYHQSTVQEYAAHAPHGQFDCLTAISVLEHVPQASVRPFLRACHMLLKPGGLLVLTVDYWDAEGPDTAHFHWMRERIYTADRIRTLLIGARQLGFRSFGTSTWKYPGPQLYDYSVASLALVRKS